MMNMINAIRVLRRCRLSSNSNTVAIAPWLAVVAVAVLAAGCGSSVSSPSPSSATTTTPAQTSLTGRVVRSDTGAGIASAQLTLVDASGNVLTSTTDTAGAFEFDNLATGTYSLQVVAGGFFTSNSTLSFPVASYSVQLAPVGPPPTPTIVSVVVTGPGSVTVGGSIQLTATAIYTDGSRRDVSNVAKWTPATPLLVGVSSSGLVTGYAAGSTVVSAAFDSTLGSLPLTVTSP